MMSHEKQGLDLDYGTAGLETVARMTRFNRWMYSTIRPFLGRRILEIGCGIGNLTQYLLEADVVLAVDAEQKYVDSVSRAFGRYPHFHAFTLKAEDERILELRAHRPDTVVFLNVLEHIAQEDAALSNARQLLPPEGRLLLLVPAFQWLYGTIDVALDHQRRYYRRQLLETLARNGLRAQACFYFNLFGLPGWWLNGKVLRKQTPSPGLTRCYDRLVPVFRAVERATGPPVGLSLIAVARRSC